MGPREQTFSPAVIFQISQLCARVSHLLTSYDIKVKGLHATHPTTAWSQNGGTVPAQR